VKKRGKSKEEPTVAKLFPNARARVAADAAIVRLDPKLPMSVYLDTWEAAYFAVAKSSPFRRG
jgi:hypothetical protein